jgi:uncharacterized protein (DUF427 family)
MNKSPGHQQQPEHHVTSRWFAQRMSVTVAGEVIAQSSNVLRVDEDGQPARFYAHAGRRASDNQTPPPIKVRAEMRPSTFARPGRMNHA